MKNIKLDTVIQDPQTGKSSHLVSYEGVMEIYNDEIKYCGYTYVRDDDGETVAVDPSLEDYNLDIAYEAYRKEYGIPDHDVQEKLINSLTKREWSKLRNSGFEVKFENGKLRQRTLSYSDWKELHRVTHPDHELELQRLSKGKNTNVILTNIKYK